MQHQLIFSFVRDCQIFAGKACGRYRRDRLERLLAAFGECVPRHATQGEYFCISQILENVSLGIARHVHASFHREHGGALDGCAFEAVRIAGQEWSALRSVAPYEAFLTSTRQYLDAFEAAHPVPAPVRAAELIRRSCVDRVSVSTIARDVACHPARLRADFKRRYSMTIREYRTRCRLRRAAVLLKRTNLPVSEIAERVGFGSRDYFYRAFVRAFGVTPAQFRRRHAVRPDVPNAR